MLCLSAFYQLLAFYSSQDDVIIGVAVSLRDDEHTQGMLGPITNTLPLRMNFSSDFSLGDLIRSVRSLCIEAFSHKKLPFEKIIEGINVERLPDRMPLFQHMIIYNHLPFSQGEPFYKDLTAKQKFISTQTSKYDFTLTLNETTDQLCGFIEYNTALYDGKRILRMLDHLKVLLDGMSNDLMSPIKNISPLTAREINTLLYEWNGTDISNDELNVIHKRFEKHVDNTPDKVAIICGSNAISYQSLNAKSNRVACYLMRQGVENGSLVAVNLRRSIELVTMLLAILKLGASYVNVIRLRSISHFSTPGIFPFVNGFA